jgi:F-type H+-transporting ATPase subunit epsilon
MDFKKLTLEVVTPERQVLHEEVDSIQLPGLDGYLGILPGHAPLLTELGVGILSFRKGDQTRYATAMGGFAEVLMDRVIVLAERSELAEEIDLGRAEAARERALKVLKEKAGEVDFRRANLSLERSLIRIQVAPRVAVHRPTGPMERETYSGPHSASKEK